VESANQVPNNQGPINQGSKKQAPKNSVPSILCVGEDAYLLSSRAAVLTKLGADLKLTRLSGVARCMVEERFDLIVLCHSVNQADAAAVAKAAHGQSPPTLVLQVARPYGAEDDEAQIRCDAVVDADPAALIRCAKGLLLEGVAMEQKMLVGR
jgi:hypothetical protein